MTTQQPLEERIMIDLKQPGEPQVKSDLACHTHHHHHHHHHLISDRRRYDPHAQLSHRCLCGPAATTDRLARPQRRGQQAPAICRLLGPAAHLILLPLSLVVLLQLVSQQCMCLSHRETFSMLMPNPAATSIFGSLLGGNGAGSSNNNNGNSAVQLSSQQAQQTAADLHQSYKNGQTSDKVTLPGDILLGGLFPIHMKGTKIECGEINRDRGIQRLEAMLYALDRINEDPSLLPDIKLGAILLDSCSSSTYALNQSLEFIRASINTVESSAFECKDKSTPRPKYGSKMIAGVVGGSYSEVSLQVANLLRLFRIPQVSYASTGTALSDKTLYDLFARTVPSDMFQARAIADIVLKLRWSYVSLVSSEGLYGDSGSKEFMKQASLRGICIATHEKVSPTTDGNAYDVIVANLLKRNATGVVLFTRAEDTRELLLAVKRAQLFNNFAWVAADGWGTHQKLVEGVEEVAWGAITVELQAKAIPGFDRYMKALTPWRNARNPWFSEYWQEWFDCQLQANLIQQQQVAAGAGRRRGGAASSGWTAPATPLDLAADYTDGSQAPGSDDVDATARKRRRSLSVPDGAANRTSLAGGDRSSVGPHRLYRRSPIDVKQFCSPNLRISESNGYRQEQKVQFVVDAVYAMAHALHQAWFNLCDAKAGVVCEALKELNGGEFYSKYLLNVSFMDLAGSEVKFDERGDGLGRYNIYNFRRVPAGLQQSTIQRQSNQQHPVLTDPSLGGLTIPDGEPGVVDVASMETVASLAPAAASNDLLVEHIYTSNVEFEYSTIGRWTESDYYLHTEDIQFIQGDSQVPESYCSRPCELGQAKIMRAGDHCCWICKTCAPFEFLPDEFSCRDCGIGRWPVANKTSCFDLPQKYLRWDSIYSLISLSIACLGIGLTLFVTIIFIKYLDTPVVKASGRELSFILLAGIAFCHLSTFVLLSKPSTFICGGQRFLVNFGFSLMYASLLVKTNRISRIFNCARRSAKRPSFISPRSQMLITGILVIIQIFLTIVWFVFEPPGIRADSPEGKRDEVILKCRVKGKSFIISLVYNMILITTCTIYAVKTRKIPENFNESKFIGFTMYTTIVIWLAFVTMFFGTNNSYEIQMNTMCVCISLSAYVTLFCLFSPKLSIILLHPDKNVRKLTMNSATYKRPLKPLSSHASQDGARNNTVGTYNGNQTDGNSQGPMSTTSNVLNLATESQVARLQESSVASNLVNSNSAASTYSNSQKKPTNLSQQLVLVGTCANCGAHQLSQVPSNCQLQLQQPAKVMAVAAGNEHKTGATLTANQRSSIMVSTASRNLSGSGASGNRAKVLHSRISMSPSKSHQPVKRMSSMDQLLLADKREHGKLARQADDRSCTAGRASSGVSLSKLNEMTEATGGHRHHCHQLVPDDASIGSSLANDSLATSQENTPLCQARSLHLADEEHAAGSLDAATGGADRRAGYTIGKGSDSVLWNQSIYSIDYCSDCCPSSYCNCSCAICASSTSGGAQNGAATTVADDETGGAICVHSLKQHRPSQDDYDAMCDSSIQEGVLETSGALESPVSQQPSRAAALWRRQSEEQSTSGASKGALVDFDSLGQERLYYFGANLTPILANTKTATSEAASSDKNAQKVPKSSKQRQPASSMEMQTIVDSSSGNKPTSQEASTSQQQARSTSSVAYALQSAASSALGACSVQEQQYATTSSKDKSSESRPSKRSATKEAPNSGKHERASGGHQQLDAAGGVQPMALGAALVAVAATAGASSLGCSIAANLEVSSKQSSRRRAKRQRGQSDKRSCLGYHDDYEYNYGLVQSNSDSENCNYYDEDDYENEEDDEDGDGNNDDEDDNPPTSSPDSRIIISRRKDDHDSDHDGRVSLHKYHQHPISSATPADSGARQTLDNFTVGSKRSGETKSSSTRRRKSSAAQQAKSNQDHPIADHKVSSTAGSETTLSPAGATLTSSNNSQTTRAGAQNSSNPYNAPSRATEQSDQTEHITCLTTL